MSIYSKTDTHWICIWKINFYVINAIIQWSWKPRTEIQLIFYICLYAYIENKLTNSQCICAWKITFIEIICWSRINFLAIIWRAKPFINIKCVKHITTGRKHRNTQWNNASELSESSSQEFQREMHFYFPPKDGNVFLKETGSLLNIFLGVK